jgi:hypothetical protein
MIAEVQIVAQQSIPGWHHAAGIETMTLDFARPGNNPARRN